MQLLVNGPQAAYTAGGMLVKFAAASGEGDHTMAHTIENKKKILHRVHRIMGQVAAVERSLRFESDCSEVLHNIAACRGAMDSLMAEVIDGHIRGHVLAQSGRATAKEKRAADDLVAALRAYLK